jgi:hypothetical protein
MCLFVRHRHVTVTFAQKLRSRRDHLNVCSHHFCPESSLCYFHSRRVLRCHLGHPRPISGIPGGGVCDESPEKMARLQILWDSCDRRLICTDLSLLLIAPRACDACAKTYHHVNEPLAPEHSWRKSKGRKSCRIQRRVGADG